VPFRQTGLNHLHRTRRLPLLPPDCTHPPKYHCFRALRIRTSVESTGPTLAFEVRRQYHSQRKGSKALPINWHPEHTPLHRDGPLQRHAHLGLRLEALYYERALRRFGALFKFALPRKVAYQSGRIGMKAIAQAFNPLCLTKAIGYSAGWV
jgi:hypothetical protein